MTLADKINDFNTAVNRQLDPVFTNPMFATVLSVALVLYGGLAAPKLPGKVSRFLNEPYVRAFIIGLILLVVTRDPLTAALIVMACLVLPKVSGTASSMATQISSFIAPGEFANPPAILRDTAAKIVETPVVRAPGFDPITAIGPQPEFSPASGPQAEFAPAPQSGPETGPIPFAPPEKICPCGKKHGLAGKKREFNAQSVLAAVGGGVNGSGVAYPSGESAKFRYPTTTSPDTKTKEPEPYEIVDIAAWDPKSAE